MQELHWYLPYLHLTKLKNQMENVELDEPQLATLRSAVARQFEAIEAAADDETVDEVVLLVKQRSSKRQIAVRRCVAAGGFAGCGC